MRGFGAFMMAAGFAAVTGGAATAAAAEPFHVATTADLLAYCDEQGTPAEVQDGQIFCEGFILGNGLMYQELVDAGTMKRIACANPVPTLAQARQAFVSWAGSNPQYLQVKPIDGFWRAMAASYPCTK
jgi:hypothetical protein